MENAQAFIKDKLKDPRWLALTAGVVGLLIGLLFGYVLFPVQWTDAAAEHLREDLRLDYLRNAVNSYTMTGDKFAAAKAYTELGDKADDTLEALVETPGFLFKEQISKYTSENGIPLPANYNGQVAAVPPQETTGETAVPAGEGRKSNGLLWIGFVLLAVLVIGAFLVYWYYFRERKLASRDNLDEITSEHKAYAVPAHQPAATPRQQAVPKPQAVPAARPQAEPRNESSRAAAAARPAGKPVAQFMTTYMFGDDLYDESFTFDAPNGEFLGECGVSISDIIGVGEPKKISAFDVWLFDKNDIQTVTKVIMSRHAFNDPNIRQRLEIRGEPVLAEPGRQVVLETATLRLEARMVDAIYGDLPLPEDSYFQRTTIELAVYRK